MLALAALALPALAAPAFAREEPARPAACRDQPVPEPFVAETYAMDGDTVSVVGKPFTVRLWGIQSSELRMGDKQESVSGMSNRAYLADILADAGNMARIEPTKWDRYCRIVARVIVKPAPLAESEGEVDAGYVLVSRGHAYTFWLEDQIKGKPELSKVYASAETRARRAKAGMWPRWLGEVAK